MNLTLRRTSSERNSSGLPAPDNATEAGVDAGVDELPPPDAELDPEPPDEPLRKRLVQGRLVDAVARAPFGVVTPARMILNFLLAGLCLLTAGGALLLLMAWRQDQQVGLLASQTERMWDIWDALAKAELYVGAAAAGVASVWAAVAALNVRRATGRRRNLLLAALSFPAGIAGAWLVGKEIVATALDNDDWFGVGGGFVLQAVMVAIPLLMLEGLADASQSRHRPARVAFVMVMGYLVTMQVSGALATIDRTTEIDGWGRTGALVLVAALLQMIAALAVSEAGRALEEATQNRFELRQRFGESILLQAGLI